MATPGRCVLTDTALPVHGANLLVAGPLHSRLERSAVLLRNAIRPTTAVIHPHTHPPLLAPLGGYRGRLRHPLLRAVLIAPLLQRGQLGNE